MNYTVNEVLQFVSENDVKFVRLAFCDIFGVQKNISILADELPRAFASGISFDASSVKGFLNVNKSDLFFYPDASTLAVLPWRPTGGRVVRMFCDIKYPDGSPFEGDCRNILKSATQRALSMGYVVKIGAESEFYLFKQDEKGEPTNIPFDNAGYMDIAPLDKGENVRREICLTLEEMGIKPVSSHHEGGPGQNEINFKYSDALSAADNFITFKSVVKTIAAKNGLFASFLPKPIVSKNGSGLHINLSLYKNNENIFSNSGEHIKQAESFIAGIMDKISEITAFTNPIVNSYERLGEFEAPKYISWSHQNRSQLIRIPSATGEYSRMELRSPDATCNPYISFALLINAGLDGIENKHSLCEETNEDLFDEKTQKTIKLNKLPEKLETSLELMQYSNFVKKVLPQNTIDRFVKQKQDELNMVNEKLKNEYFRIY